MPITTIATEEVARRTMNLFFLVDTSGSMAGRKIATLNQAVREALPIIKEISEDNADACIKIAVLEFSDSVKWMYTEPIDANDFEWTDLGTNCLTSMGAAFGELNAKLSRNAFMASQAYQPVVILLSDGAPTDAYQHNLEKLKANKWFQAATKVAIAIGDDADKNVLAEFTNGNIEAVFSADNVYLLKTIIKIASVQSYLIGSQSSTSSDKTKEEQIIEKINEEYEERQEEAEQLKDQADSDDEGIFDGF